MLPPHLLHMHCIACLPRAQAGDVAIGRSMYCAGSRYEVLNAQSHPASCLITLRRVIAFAYYIQSFARDSAGWLAGWLYICEAICSDVLWYLQMHVLQRQLLLTFGDLDGKILQDYD